MRLFAGTPWDRPPRCERCHELEADCRCPPPPLASPPPASPPTRRQTVRVRLEKRKGKRLVTVLYDLAAKDRDRSALLTTLKSECGAGGTLQAETLEIQGDQVAKMKSILVRLGYQVR